LLTVRGEIEKKSRQAQKLLVPIGGGGRRGARVCQPGKRKGRFATGWGKEDEHGEGKVASSKQAERKPYIQ